MTYSNAKRSVENERFHNKVFLIFRNYFSDEYETVFATDIGSWDMTITNTKGNYYLFKISLCWDFEVYAVDISDLILNILEISDLFLFDGNNNWDSVNRIAIEY
ncbi:MAG: hypothetical protein RSF40_10035 [Oscillospiraceae bacterium]